MRSNPFSLPIALLGFIGLGVFSGCAISPKSSDHKARSDAMLREQIIRAQNALTSDAPPRLVYVGLAMDDTTRAFRGDIDLAEKRLREIDPNLIAIKLHNPPVTSELDLPFALRDEFSKVANEVFSRVRPQDKTVVLFATHGNPERLSVRAGGERFAPVNPKFLNDIFFKPLTEKATLVIVSACYGGSFIDSLKAPSRIVLAAAAKDRTSFGCQFTSTNTFFVDGVFGSNWDRTKSLASVFDAAKASIELREKSDLRGINLPSQPQISSGERVARWLDQPIRNWMNLP
jgi:hypothetical protein